MAMESAGNGVATTSRSTFGRTTSVATVIQAPAATVWEILVDAGRYPDWNTTIVSLSGDITLGSQLKLVSTLDPSRTFKLKIKTFEPASRLAWGDALGTRVYTLDPAGEGGTRFEMTEHIGGPVFPLFASRIPSFDASFEQFAADLKTAAETAVARER